MREGNLRVRTELTDVLQALIKGVERPTWGAHAPVSWASNLEFSVRDGDRLKELNHERVDNPRT